MKKLFILLLVIGFLAPFQLSAGIHGYLKGKVVNEDGQGVPGANVFIMGTKRGAVVNSSDGSFRVANIEAGTYNVQISAVGLEKIIVENVRISADQTTDIGTITLTVDAVTVGEIEVVAAKEMVNKTEVGNITTVSDDDITGVPSEGIQGIVGSKAGVRSTGGGFGIRGMRDSETQIKVDGRDVSNAFSGGTSLSMSYFPMVSSFAVEEVQVLTGGFSAEYGEAQGGVVNTIVKRGRTDRYEGVLRWRTDVAPLWGSQSSSIEVLKEGTDLVPYITGEGAKLQGEESNNIDMGFGGPIPFLDGSTFYISTRYSHEGQLSNSYEIYDPLGNNIGKTPDSKVWVKNITGRLRFALTDDIQLVAGGMYGITSWSNPGWSSIYRTTEGLVYDENLQPVLDADGNQLTNGIQERLEKSNVANAKIGGAFVKINHSLSQNSFYELRISQDINIDENGRRANYDDPDFINGFEIIHPQDKYVVEGSELVKLTDANTFGKGDKIIDHYQQISKIQTTKDGYLLKDIPQPNPLTGYVEGPSSANGTSNAWGLNYFFGTMGGGGFSFRDGGFWTVDGSYTLSKDIGEFSHTIKTGFLMKLWTLHRHYNGMPYDGNPFFDVYTDNWGGNLYADNIDVYNETSQPYTPSKYEFYVTDQISFKGLILNPGLRFDLFNPNSEYRTITDRFVSINADSGFAQADWKWQISPRLSVNYPITDRQYVSIAYGLYYKTPLMQNMFDRFNIDVLRGNEILGDPNMKAQRTNAYQLVYKNQLTDDFALHMSAYYNDIYNQLGIKYIPAVPDAYFQYTVAEYGNTKGIELSLRKRPSMDHVGFELNYTLAQASGTSSSPTSNYMLKTDPFTGVPAYPMAEYPLAWDIRHRVNFILSFVWGDDEGPSIGNIYLLENMNLTFETTYRSGAPYTRTDNQGNPISEINSERGPSYWRVDSRLAKRFMLKDWFGDGAGNTSFEVFVDIYNLFNRTEPTGYYSATGSPDDDGISLERKVGQFANIKYYKDPDYANPSSISVAQYDILGNRLYSEMADHDKNGVVTQAEQYESYINYIETLMKFRGLYQTPIRVYAGVMFRF